MRKSILAALLAFVLSIVIVSAVTANCCSPPTTTVYLDPPTITGVTVGETFTVNLNILDALSAFSWQAGMLFNPAVLKCTGYNEGEFLETGGTATWFPNTIDNVAGEITFHSCSLSGADRASGSGRLAYLTFEVVAPGVSDIHLRDVIVLTGPGEYAYIYIIDVFTVVVDATHYTVVTVSDSTDMTGTYHSGFYNHAFMPCCGISFYVTGPNPGFSNVTIPKTFMWVDALPEWTVLIDDISVSRTVTENGTHTSIYFMYSYGIHKIEIISTHVVPEFPSAIILSLFMLFTLIAVALTKKIVIRRNSEDY